MNTQRPNKHLAFTLVELLTVIGIIGILAVLVLTAVSQAKGRALRIQCANDVRQLGFALQTFVTDHNVYPLAVSPDSEVHTWINALQNEIESRPVMVGSAWLHQDVWHCPSAYRPSNFPQNLGYIDYGFNAYGFSSLADTNSLGLGGHYVGKGLRLPAPSVNESELVRPSEMMAIGDGFFGGGGIIADGMWPLGRAGGKADLMASYPNYPNYSEGTKRAYARHQGKANVAFCDGHVESPTLKFLFEDTSDEALSRWNRDHLPHRERLSP